MHLKNLPQSIKRKTVHTWRQFKESIKLHENFFRQARGRRIVVYHGICEKDHLKFNGIFLRRQSFEKHLQFYQKYFNIVSLTDFYKENLSEKIITPVLMKEVTSVWAQYTIRLPRDIERTELITELKAAGVPAVIYYAKPLQQTCLPVACI